MWDLRWVLLGLGALVLLGVYLWSRGIVSRDLLPTLPRRKERTEPSIGEPPPPLPEPPPPQPESLVETVSEEEKARPGPERVVALRLIPRGAELSTERAVSALRNAGLEHGRYAIFHRQLGTNREGFSVASLTEPGSFDMDNLGDATIAGLSFFRFPIRRDGRDRASHVRRAGRRSLRRARQLLEQPARALFARRAHRVPASG